MNIEKMTRQQARAAISRREKALFPLFIFTISLILFGSEIFPINIIISAPFIISLFCLYRSVSRLKRDVNALEEKINNSLMEKDEISTYENMMMFVMATGDAFGFESPEAGICCNICSHWKSYFEINQGDVHCYGTASEYFPHNYNDPAPALNPWQYWREQVLGMPLPPSSWNSKIVWNPSCYVTGYGIKAWQRKGLDYWATHYNHAWHLGRKRIGRPEVATPEELIGNYTWEDEHLAILERTKHISEEEKQVPQREWINYLNRKRAEERKNSLEYRWGFYKD